MMRGPDIAQLQRQQQWSRARVIHELRRAAARRRYGTLPKDDDLRRMLRGWINGDRGLSDRYAELLSDVFGVAFVAGKGEGRPDSEVTDELKARLAEAQSVDAELVALLERQTEGLRTLDRRLGARELLAQTTAHVDHLVHLLAYSLPGGVRSDLAAAAAEAAALAGWQALDLGRPDDAWRLHETAKTAAKDSGSPAVLAHVTAQQAYALMDVERPADALALIQHSGGAAADSTPAVMRGWLRAAEAEALSAMGEEQSCRRALDDAGRLVEESAGESLPYVFLDETHLARWRGHCLARLGAVEAIDHLTRALEALDPSFARAAAGHHCDLALAYAQRGEKDAAKRHVEQAEALATRTSSARQRRRLAQIRFSVSRASGR